MKDLLVLTEELSSWELTVSEQARTAENNPELRWENHFVRTPVGSTRLSDVEVTETREISDRREWNADGRFIPAKTPKIKDISMVPMESYFVLGEEEMQRLFERNGMNSELVLRAAKALIPQRVNGLVDTIFRGLEFEAFQSWATGQIVAQNPQTGKTMVASQQIAADRYVTAGTAWSDSNAFDELMKYVYLAQEKIGEIEGVYLRLAELLKIQKSAPRLTTTEVRMSTKQISERISEEIGSDFYIQVDERTVDRFTGAGANTVKTKIWSQGKVAFIPSGGQVGRMLQAPQARAQNLPEVAAEFVDINGIMVYYESLKNGKALKVEAQANWLPILNEQNVYVVDAG